MIANKFAKCMFAMQRPVFMAQAPVMNFSGAGKKYEEASVEKAFFSKNDAELLKKLVEKMDKRQVLNDPKKEQFDAMCDDLDELFKTHGMDKTEKDQLLYQDLIQWKRHNHD
jgi:hypothetical protein